MKAAIAQDMEELTRLLSEIVAERTAYRDACPFELSYLVDGVQLVNISLQPVLSLQI